MKTAEEWMNSFGRFPNDQKQEESVWNLVKLPESVLPKVSFWNSVLTENDIEQIQLDAMKEGMRRAANECDKRVECTGNGQRWWEDRNPNEIKKYILTTAEQLTEKDL